jgi:hypothetical protein
MRRALLALLLAAGLSLAAALPATADPVAENPPACGDVFGFEADIIYHQQSEPQNTVEGTIFTAEPSCRNVAYTMYVTYLSGGKEKVKSLTVHGTGDSFVQFLIRNVTPDAGSTPCVWFESVKGGTVIDRAPDEGCITANIDQSPGGSVLFG